MGKRPHVDVVVALCLSSMSGNCLAAGAAARLLALAGSCVARSQSTVTMGMFVPADSDLPLV